MNIDGVWKFVAANWLSLLIGIVSCLSFALLQFNGLSAIGGWFLPRQLVEIPARILNVWTPSFVHYTWLHLLTNLYLWWQFAPPLEAEGRRRFLLLLLTGAGASNMLQWAFDGPNFGGLSGVIYFLFALSWVINRYSDVPRYKIDPIITIGLLVMLPLAASGQFGKFADVAHFSGLLLGGLVGFVLVKAGNKSVQ